MKNDLGKCIKSFNCESVLNGKRILLITATILIFIYCLLHADFHSVSAEFISSAVIFVLLLIVTVSGFITQKKCFVSVNENGIYGIKPTFPGRAKYFTVYYKDITNIHDLIMPLSKVPPVAFIKTYQKNLLLTCLNKEDLDFLIKYCKTKACRRDKNEMS